jgi:hypothetical protein
MSIICGGILFGGALFLGTAGFNLALSTAQMQLSTKRVTSFSKLTLSSLSLEGHESILRVFSLSRGCFVLSYGIYYTKSVIN